MPSIYPRESNLAALTALAGAGGSWNGAKLRLFQDGITPGPSTVLADLTAATYTGSGDSTAVTWNAARVDENNDERIAGSSKQFLQTGTGTVNVIGGVAYVGDPAGTAFLIATKLFAAPIGFTITNRGVVVTPDLMLMEGGTDVVYARQGTLRALTFLTTALKYLDGAVVRLGTNVTRPGDATTLADMVPATFNGYAESSAVVWGSPFIDVDGSVKVVGGSKQFTKTAGGSSETVTCWYLVGDPGGTEYLIKVFWYDSSIPVVTTGQGIVVLPDFTLSEAI